MRRRQAGLGFIFITILIDVLGFGLVIPILPTLIEKVSHGGPAEASRYYGAFLAVYGAMQFIASPVLGSLSDRWGRRPVLLISLFFTGIDYIIMALAPSVWWLFVGRTLSGITGASFAAATSYIADISPPERRAQNFGLIGAAFGIGFIVGPALGGVLGNYGLRVPFVAAAVLAGLNGLYGLLILPESLTPEHRRRFAWKSVNPLSSIPLMRRTPLALGLTLSTVMVNLGQQGLQATWVLYNTFRYGWKPSQNGLSLAAVGLVAGIVQAGLMRRLVPWLGERRLIIGGLMINAIGLLLYGLATRGWMILAIIPLTGLGFVAGPATQSLLSREYGPDEQGAVQGALTSLSSLTSIVGPVISTSLFGYFVSPTAPVIIPGVSFFLSFALTLISLGFAIYALRLRRLRPEVSMDPTPGGPPTIQRGGGGVLQDGDEKEGGRP